MMDAIVSPFFWTTCILVVVVAVLGFKLKQLQGKLDDAITHDRLSNALEWPFIEERSKMMVRHCRRYNEKASFLMLECDETRKIFNGHGPAAADEALVLLAQAVLKVIREVDLFGKYSTGKFILCLPNTDLNGSVIVAERIRQTITELRPQKYPMSYTVSVGCAELHDEESMEKGIERANKALLRAQHYGGNQVSSSKKDEAKSRRNSVWPNILEK